MILQIFSQEIKSLSNLLQYIKKSAGQKANINEIECYINHKQSYNCTVGSDVTNIHNY